MNTKEFKSKLDVLETKLNTLADDYKKLIDEAKEDGAQVEGFRRAKNISFILARCDGKNKSKPKAREASKSVADVFTEKTGKLQVAEPQEVPDVFTEKSVTRRSRDEIKNVNVSKIFDTSEDKLKSKAEAKAKAKADAEAAQKKAQDEAKAKSDASKK
jgi:hypothetical protein